MSFKSGKKIAFIIDMTDLNRFVNYNYFIYTDLLVAKTCLIWNSSVYPSEPSELIKVFEAHTTLAQPSIDETMASIRNLQSGRTAILRLCRMVSRLIHGYNDDLITGVQAVGSKHHPDM
jgi:hypothetical protein